jgi:hypothetical protein
LTPCSTLVSTQAATPAVLLLPPPSTTTSAGGGELTSSLEQAVGKAARRGVAKRERANGCVLNAMPPSHRSKTQTARR